jgi:hypothetical protein
MRGIRARLAKLLKGRAAPATCTGGTTTFRFNGEPLPPAADRPRCPHCGGEHVLEVTEVVVRTREEVAALKARGDHL